MLDLFICGACTVSHQAQEEKEDKPWSRSSSSSSSRSGGSPPSTPRAKSRKKNKNPYSDLGLDKFSALVQELEEKKQKIYSEMGSQGISLIRFVYSSSDDIVPLVIRLKDPNKEDKKAKVEDVKEDVKDEVAAPRDAEVSDKLQGDHASASDEKDGKQLIITKRCAACNMKLRRLRRPSYYVPLVVILILFFLMFFGRSVTILFTSVAWYLVPTLSSRSTPRKTKKKGYVRRLSDVNNGVAKDRSSPPFMHQKSS